MDPDAQQLIERFGMEPHREGGWYRETWRAPTDDGSRAASTAILYLLAVGERSHWHRIDADEVWCHHAGASLVVRTASDNASPTTTTLGSDLLAGQLPQMVIPADTWQTAHSTGAWTLVSCVVAPGFTFDGFTLAGPDFEPG